MNRSCILTWHPLRSFICFPSRLEHNTQVVANAITALSEIEEAAFEETGEAGTVFKIDSSILAKLLIALGECTEWGRISLLTAIAKYQAGDEKEAEHICERVVPQFQHANGSVVLAAIKVGDARNKIG